MGIRQLVTMEYALGWAEQDLSGPHVFEVMRNAKATFRRVPVSVRGLVADTISAALEAFLSRPCAGSLRDLFMLPKAVLGGPVNQKSGLSSASVACLVTTRTSRWLAGDRTRLWEEVLKQPGDDDSQRRGGYKRRRNGRAFVSRQAWYDEDPEVQQLESCVTQVDKELRASQAGFTSEVLDLAAVGAFSKAMQLVLSDGLLCGHS